MEKAEQNPDVQIINDEPEDNPSQPSSVTVDLDAKPVPKQADQPKVQVDSKLPEDIKKLHNTIAYQNRKLDQAMRQLQETQVQIATLREQRTVPQNAPKELDEIDEIAQKDWKQGVKKLVEKEFNVQSMIEDAFAKREKATAEIQHKKTLENELEKSKQRVLERYPTIEDETSEESSLYRQVVNEDSSLLSNVHGPEIAMYRMEEKMRQTGKIPSSSRPMIDKEAQRLARAGVSSVVGRQPSPNGKITLTKEQKEFCDHYSIPYEQYAKNLKAQDFRGGVEA